MARRDGAERRPRYIVAQPDALAGEAAIWACTPLPVLHDWLRIRLLTSCARYLPAAFSDARFAMFGTAMTGATGEPPRWRRRVALVTNLLADDVGRQYAATYLPPEAHDAAARPVRNIVEALDAKLASADWLTPATRARARAKLARTRLKIGYPDRWTDDMRVRIDRPQLLGCRPEAAHIDDRYPQAIEAGCVGIVRHADQPIRNSADYQSTPNADIAR